jgi:hypothetical protein
LPRRHVHGSGDLAKSHVRADLAKIHLIALWGFGHAYNGTPIPDVGLLVALLAHHSQSCWPYRIRQSARLDLERRFAISFFTPFLEEIEAI